jgi:hypothetical protein
MRSSSKRQLTPPQLAGVKRIRSEIEIITKSKDPKVIAESQRVILIIMEKQNLLDEDLWE